MGNCKVSGTFLIKIIVYIIKQIQYDVNSLALMQTRTEYDYAGRVLKQIIMANPSSTNGYDTVVDNITETLGVTVTYFSM